MEAQLQSQVSPCKIGGSQSDEEAGLSLSTLVSSCQYCSISAPYSFIHLSSALSKLSVII